MGCNISNKTFARPYHYRRHMLEIHNQLIEPSWRRISSPMGPIASMLPIAPPIAPPIVSHIATITSRAPMAPIAPMVPIAPMPPIATIAPIVPIPTPHFVFKHPFTMMVAGPTSCGKTTWIMQTL